MGEDRVAIHVSEDLCDLAERGVEDKWRREFKSFYGLSIAFMMKLIMTENVMLVSVPIAREPILTRF